MISTLKTLKLKKLLEERVFTLGVTLLILIVICAILWPTKFPTFSNLSLVLLNLSIETIVAVGMMILLISGVFDLSVGSVVAFSGGVAAYLMAYQDMNPLLAASIGMLSAVLIGLINGLLIAKAGINPLIQTLAMMGIVRGLALMISGGGIQDLPAGFNAFGQAKILGFQSPVWIMLLVVSVFSFLVYKKVFFKNYFYIGGNEKAAFLSGIKVEKMRIISFVMSASFAGFAGILLTARMGAAIGTTGQGMELRVITAAILGGASLLGGEGRIIGAMLGAIFMGLVSNVMIMARVTGYWQEIILGLILIVVVWIDIFLKRRSEINAVEYAKKAIGVKK
ncbi:MAG: ABC transporter permease [Cyclobacteriaceae bacterium]|nr:ABC transporter permease [Cyclobacteriaceae bacterium HetDA_MAG_MS6]